MTTETTQEMIVVTSAEDYIAKADVTESLNIEAIKERLFANPVMLEEFVTLLNAQIKLSDTLGGYKSHFFYGKPFDRAATEKHFESSPAVTITPEQFQEMLSRSDKTLIRLIHSVTGISTEVGEIIEPVLNTWLHGIILDVTNLCEELGDIEWYSSRIPSIFRDLGWTFTKIWSINITKLWKRNKITMASYMLGMQAGEGFSAENTINRDTASERLVLDDLTHGDSNV